MARADELGSGESVEFLRAVDEVNVRARERVVDLAVLMLGGSALARRVAVLGATFKPDSDDVRDSPALTVAQAMFDRGAFVRVHDPRGLDNARRDRPDLDFALDIDKACEDADIVVHLTEWSDYAAIDPAELAKIVAKPQILDARNTLEIDRWRVAGWSVRALGRPRA